MYHCTGNETFDLEKWLLLIALRDLLKIRQLALCVSCSKLNLAVNYKGIVKRISLVPKNMTFYDIINACSFPARSLD